MTDACVYITDDLLFFFIGSAFIYLFVLVVASHLKRSITLRQKDSIGMPYSFLPKVFCRQHILNTNSLSMTT